MEFSQCVIDKYYSREFHTVDLTRATMDHILRKSHFLGAKLRALRKQNHMTLEEFSQRCIQQNPKAAPSVSYLSMIESGRRTPSEDVLALIASVFNRDATWFLDQNAELAPISSANSPAGAARIPLEPAFLFSKELLQAAIPELLSQTGTTGRQFAHLLIRSFQEMSRNEFPDLERAAEEVGARAFSPSVDDLMGLCQRHGLEIRWFDRKPVRARAPDRELRSMVRSFFEPPGTVFLNRALLADPARLKFDLASNLGHKVLHGGDGMKSPHATGGEMGGSPEGGEAYGLAPNDVLHAWRDFECSFFAGALLCPRIPFRRFLARERYRIEAATKLELTPAVVMRRMTKVSPYPYWHFFDAYAPGHLRAVYRGNGIPLPWGNMTNVTDPCPNWAVFRLIRDARAQAGSQISILRHGDHWLLYCCHSLRARDMGGNPHVLSVGVDLSPALSANGVDAQEIVDSIAAECHRHGGTAKIPRAAAEAIRTVATVLNIAWLEDSLAQSARIICPRSMHCPQIGHCEGVPVTRARNITDVRQEILGALKSGAPIAPAD